MTAEVAILNRGAVAIAADSAVTIGRSALKIYNTANKIFPLSTSEPVAVMVYGAGSFGSIPWETVIKEYRSHLGTTTYGTVEEYASSLKSHLPTLIEHVSRRGQLSLVAATADFELKIVARWIQRALMGAAMREEPPNDSRVHDEIIGNIYARTSLLQENVVFDDLSASDIDQELDDLIEDWSTFVEHKLDELPSSDEIKSMSRDMLNASLLSAEEKPFGSGVVVTGFGVDQLFPALSHHRVDGILANRVKAWEVGSVSIGADQSAGIYPFAQEDMVTTFMRGIHPDYEDVLGHAATEAIGFMVESLKKQVGNWLPEERLVTLFEEMDRVGTQSFYHIMKSFRDFGHHNSNPIISMVELLPKEELAEMAEALVNLTSFKQKVTSEAETVGGPTDVAVISKGDGLVWVKRKHYFPSELNPRYFDRD